MANTQALKDTVELLDLLTSEATKSWARRMEQMRKSDRSQTDWRLAGRVEEFSKDLAALNKAGAL